MSSAASAGSVELTFLGHQSWHLRAGDTVVLVDPILTPAFGAGAVEFPVWPPRRVDHGAMPAPDAVLLTHEHLDHLHFASLALLDRTTPIHTGQTLPAAVVEALTTLGFTVHRHSHHQPITIGDLEVWLYPAGARTLFWESRVVQPVVRRAGSARDVFIGVDADISDLYVEQIRAGRMPVPWLAVVSNNTQSVPYGALGADVNLLPGLDGPRHRTTGIQALHTLLIDYLEPLDGVREVALCGNGFTAPRSPHGPFLYADHRALAQAANLLQHLFRVHGPRPGDQLTVPPDGPLTTGSAAWVSIDAAAEQAGLDRLDAFLADPRPVEPTPVGPAIPPEDSAAVQRLVAAELPRLARHLIATRTGALATSLHDYLYGPLDGRRLLLRLLAPPGRLDQIASYAWDITGPAFAPVPTTLRDEAMATYPFGIEIFYQDLVALLAGRLQVWDIVGGSYQGWYVGERLDSPVYALFAVYGEHQRPDLAARCYTESLARLTGLAPAPSAP
ncbi:MBL fold metallo-hydrolase [Parafrankia elaeagni]|uniref:MBL fold metallo-hydrolase n=1 Tax=Parafrankia elaeagni TaxID=222534 RepID=UPI000360571B|nr:MBL fold metallo-hydrolase [Parafrankia elaeagni]